MNKLEEFKRDEIRANGEDYLKTMLQEEFNQVYSELELAKLFVDNGDNDLYFEEFIEMEFERYCEDRLDNY